MSTRESTPSEGRTVPFTIQGAWKPLLKLFAPTIVATLVTTYFFGVWTGAIAYLACAALTLVFLRLITLNA